MILGISLPESAATTPDLPTASYVSALNCDHNVEDRTMGWPKNEATFVRIFETSQRIYDFMIF